ncbi:MAG TPA: 4Fe-4S binding protein [Campylobacterales bacterium]|nr:4Fe-4S binding protein [Campylobacterales bacterium]
MNKDICEYRMIIDAKKCVGCHACEAACKQEFQAPLGVFRTMTLYMDIGAYPSVKREFLPIMCRQCEDANCKKACSKGAIFEKDGIVSIDTSMCDGCGECVKACGIGAAYINPYTKIAEKCNLCSHRLEIGLKAACEATCVAEAIKIIDILKQSISSEAKAFKMNAQERPRTLHIGANDKMKTKLKSGRNFSPLNYEIYSWAEGASK